MRQIKEAIRESPHFVQTCQSNHCHSLHGIKAGEIPKLVKQEHLSNLIETCCDVVVLLLASNYEYQRYTHFQFPSIQVHTSQSKMTHTTTILPGKM